MLYEKHITKNEKAQALLDKVRQFALEIKQDTTVAWAWIVTPDLIKVEAHVFDFEVVYILSDLNSSMTTTSYSEAISALSNALVA